MSKKWFVIHARSGYEAKVKLAIEEAVAREGLEDLVGEILIPTEQVVELKGGNCLLYTSPSPRDATLSRMPSSA